VVVVQEVPDERRIHWYYSLVERVAMEGVWMPVDHPLLQSLLDCR
jgi:hypothetical protein